MKRLLLRICLCFACLLVFLQANSLADSWYQTLDLSSGDHWSIELKNPQANGHYLHIACLGTQTKTADQIYIRDDPNYSINVYGASMIQPWPSEDDPMYITKCEVWETNDPYTDVSVVLIALHWSNRNNSLQYVSDLLCTMTTDGIYGWDRFQNDDGIVIRQAGESDFEVLGGSEDAVSDLLWAYYGEDCGDPDGVASSYWDSVPYARAVLDNVRDIREDPVYHWSKDNLLGKHNAQFRSMGLYASLDHVECADGSISYRLGRSIQDADTGKAVATVYTQVNVDPTFVSSGVKNVAFTSVKAPIPYTLFAYSSGADSEIEIHGLYQDNMFFAPAESLSVLINGQVLEDKAHRVSFNMDTNLRTFYAQQSGTLKEAAAVADETTGEKWVHDTGVPCLFYQDKIYISCFHFLKYANLPYILDQNARYQLMVYVPGSLYSSIAQYLLSGNGNFFYWDDFALSDSQIKEMLSFAHDTVILNRSDGWLETLFSVEDIEAEAMEEVLINLIGNEGQGVYGDIITINEASFDYFKNAADGADTMVQLADMIYSPSEISAGIMVAQVLNGSRTLEQMEEWINTGGDEVYSGFSALSLGLDFAGDILSAVDSMRIYNRVTQADRELLSRTLIDRQQESSVMTGAQSGAMRKAVSAAAIKMQDPEGSASAQLLLDTIQNVYTAASNAMTIQSFSLVPAAGQFIIKSALPFADLDAQENVYQAYCAVRFSEAAIELVSNSYAAMMSSSFPSKSRAEQQAIMDDLRYAMILQLKGSLTARELMISSGKLESSAIEALNRANKDTLRIMRNVQECFPTCAGYEDIGYSDDLSWMGEDIK